MIVRRAVQRGVPAIVLAAVLGACGGDAPIAGPTAAPSADAPPGSSAIAEVDPAKLRYTCGGPFSFGAEVLVQAGGHERVDDPLALALREHLATPDTDIDWLPDAGWTLVGQDLTGAEFVASGRDGMYSVALSRETGAWKVAGWGGCNPVRVLPDGLGPATWVIAEDTPVGPDTTTFDALVTERACASAQSSEGRVVGPDVLAIGDTVLVTFAVRELEGAQNCPGNPATRVTVTLPEPLGERRLLDGSTLPPREPVEQE